MRIVRGWLFACIVGCGDEDTSAEALADILDSPHDCSIERQIHGDDRGAWGDCYDRVVWGEGCQDPTPTLDALQVVGAISPYNWFGSGPTFTITDAATFEAFWMSIPLAPDPPPVVDFTTYVVAGIYSSHSQCDGDGGEGGIANGHTIYARRHDASGTCSAQCDGFAEVVGFYAIPRSAGFPRFCIDEFNTCDDP